MFKVRRIFHRAKEKTKGESKVLPISVLKVAEEEDKNNAAQNNQRLIEINPDDEADQTTNSPNKLVLATPQSHGKLMVTNVTNDEGFLRNLKTNKGSICSFVGTGDQNDILVHRLKGWRHLVENYTAYFRTLVDIQNEAVSRYEKAANSIKVPISEDYVFAPPTLDGIHSAAKRINKFLSTVVKSQARTKAEIMENTLRALNMLISDINVQLNTYISLVNPIYTNLVKHRKKLEEGEKRLQLALELSQVKSAASKMGDPFLINFGMKRDIEDIVEIENTLHSTVTACAAKIETWEPTILFRLNSTLLIYYRYERDAGVEQNSHSNNIQLMLRNMDLEFETKSFSSRFAKYIKEPQGCNGHSTVEEYPLKIQKNPMLAIVKQGYVNRVISSLVPQKIKMHKILKSYLVITATGFMHCFDVAGGVPQPVPDTSFHLESVGVMDGETANLPQTHFVLAVNKNTARGKGTTMRTKFTFMAFNAEEAADWCEKIRYWSVGNHESLFSGEDIVEDYSDFHITIKRNRNTNHLNKIEGPHNNISIGSGHPLRNVSRLAITDAANTNEYHNITLKKDVLSISRTNINGPDMLKEFESNSAVIRRSGVYEAETTDFDLNGASETVKKFTSIRYSGSSTPAAPLLVDGYMHVQPADSNSLYNERVLRIPNNRFISENNLESLPQSSRGQSYGLPLNNPKGMSENSGQSIPYQAHHVSAAFSEKTDTSAFENPELQEKNQTQLQALPAKNQYLCDSGQPKSPQPTVNSQTHGSSRIKYVNDTHGLYNPGSDTSSQSQKNLHNNANFYANTPESHTYIETKSTKNTDYANSLSSKLDLSSKRRNVKYADNPDDIDSVSTELPPHNPVLKKPTNQNNKPSNPVENGGSPTTSVKYKTDYDENHLVNDEDVECQSNSRSIAFDTSNSGSTRSKNKQDLIIQTNKIYTPRNSSDKYNGHYSSRRGSDTIYTGNRTANRDSSSKAIYLKDLLLSDRLSTTPIDDSTAINAQNIIMQNISNVDLSFPLNGTLDVESYELSTKITRQSTDEILSLSKYSLPNTDPVYNDGISRYTTRNTKKKTTFSNINDSGEEGTNIEISTEAASYNKKVGLVGASFFK